MMTSAVSRCPRSRAAMAGMLDSATGVGPGRRCWRRHQGCSKRKEAEMLLPSAPALGTLENCTGVPFLQLDAPERLARYSGMASCRRCAPERRSSVEARTLAAVSEEALALAASESVLAEAQRAEEAPLEEGPELLQEAALSPWQAKADYRESTVEPWNVSWGQPSDRVP